VLAPTGVPLLDAADLPTAVRLAASHAQPGEAVVMSPACASFDMFRNYGHRAQVFCDTVAELAAEKGMAGVGE
jgi:UDP-N-acetylmuramoylalanine--D-glutamate ligase